jgi:hypothetical protein
LIYARALDQTVAEDYFRAMQQVEQQLVLPVDDPKRLLSASEMLALADSLVESTLDPSQFEIISALRARLTSLAGRNLLMMDVKVLMDS